MNTVLILGAGASSELGYPLGKELNERIWRKLDKREFPNHPYREALRELGITEELIDEFQSALHSACFPTIDDFIESRPEFVSIGKLAITLELVSYEHEGGLVGMARTTWYASLLGILRSNPRLAANGEISVVTFNYDRSLEHFLHVAVTASSPPEVPSEILRVLRPDSFLHIHGKIGLLPWESEVGRRYSHDISPDEILQSAQMIRLPHESPEINSRIEAIIQNAQVVMFLGFGFHPTNLRKICFERLRDFGVVRGFATMIEIPPDRMGEITRFFPMEIVTTKISDCVEKLKLISRAENGMRQ